MLLPSLLVPQRQQLDTLVPGDATSQNSICARLDLALLGLDHHLREFLHTDLHIPAVRGFQCDGRRLIRGRPRHEANSGFFDSRPSSIVLYGVSHRGGQ
jgi:hypothetical protein